MRPIKTIRPTDLAIRGLFLSVVLIGGIVGHLQHNQAVPGTATNVRPVEAGMGIGFGLPFARQCSLAEAGAARADAHAQVASHRQVLSGSVLSSDGCAPIGGAKIEFWPDGPAAAPSTSIADGAGRYRLQCDIPAADDDEAGYIHLRVSADGYNTLTTQYAPRADQADDHFDIVLQPGK